MKKLKMPMYTPVFPSGSEPASMEYGMDRMLAQAMPTPVMERSRSTGVWITATESSPAAPASRQIECVPLRPR